MPTAFFLTATSDNCTASVQYSVGYDAINPINEHLYYTGDFPPQIQPMEEVLALLESLGYGPANYRWRKMMSHALKITVSLVLLVAVSVLSGCGTMQAYPGEARSPDQVAIIKPGHRFGPNAEILSIDGRKLGSGKDRAEVLPGRHTISARVIVSNGEDMTVVTNPMELHLDAQAGHTYELFGEAAGGGWFSAPTEFGIWIQDKDSNTLVTSVGLDPQ